MRPVQLASVGLGGYAGMMFLWLFPASDAPDPLIKLVAVAEPNLAQFPEHVEKLNGRGVKLFASYEQLITQPGIEAVWLPVPIDLHRPFVEMAMRAGKAAVVEKPVTGSVDDLAAMIAARDAAKGRVAVGFQDIYAEATLDTKQRLLDGDLGTIRSATVQACVPRGEHYYQRNTWAGRMKHNGTWVLDSPANNAVAHYLNLALFLLGRSLPAMAKLESVTAELYRVYDIENYDTCSLRVMTEGGVPLLVHFTHACRESVAPTIVVHGEQGVMRYVAGREATFTASETIKLPADPRPEMVAKIARWIRGDREVIPASLEMAGAHLTVINGASEASPVKTVPFERLVNEQESVFRVLPGVEAAFERCSADQKLLSELGSVPWASPGGRANLSDYRHFKGPAS